MFDLAETFSANARGVIMPQAKYLESYSDFLNKMVVLTPNFEAFKAAIKEDSTLQASDDDIKSAHEVSNFKVSQDIMPIKPAGITGVT
jgi:hypothetical protein